MKRNSSHRIYVLFLILVLAGISVYFSLSWSNWLTPYLLPEYPNLQKVGYKLGVELGKRMGFPRAGEIAWENENSILFIDYNSNEFYRYSIHERNLEKVFRDYKALYIHPSADKRTLAFTGWGKNEGRFPRLWISENNGDPSRVSKEETPLYDFDLFGWTSDDESFIVDYICDPRLTCMGLLQKESGELTTIYKMDRGLRFGYVEIDQRKIVFVTLEQSNILSILDISLGVVTPIDFGDKTIIDVNYIPSKKWLVGVAGGQVFFASDDLKCIKYPFTYLSEIQNVDALETASGISLLLKDKSNLLYILDINKADENELFARNSGCNNEPKQ